MKSLSSLFILILFIACTTNSYDNYKFINKTAAIKLDGEKVGELTLKFRGEEIWFDSLTMDSVIMGDTIFIDEASVSLYPTPEGYDRIAFQINTVDQAVTFKELMWRMGPYQVESTDPNVENGLNDGEFWLLKAHGNATCPPDIPCGYSVNFFTYDIVPNDTLDVFVSGYLLKNPEKTHDQHLGSTIELFLYKKLNKVHAWKTPVVWYDFY